jgi:hypothetical protein
MASKSTRKPARQRTKGRRSKKKAITSTKVKGEAITLDFTTTTTNGDNESSLTIKLKESLIWLMLNQSDMAEYEVEGTVDAVIDSILEKQKNDNDNDHDHDSTLTNNKSIDFIKKELIESLSEYLSMEQSTTIIERVIPYLIGQVDNYKEIIIPSNLNTADGEEDDNENINTEKDEDLYNSDKDEAAYTLAGSCEFCDREIKTTRHHLIPKETWDIMKPRFVEAETYFKGGEMDKVVEILGTGTIPESLRIDHFRNGKTIKNFLGNHTCNVCRLCHRKIHEVFDNLTLAESRNSVTKLLENEEIYKLCKWASTQKSNRRI